METRRSLLPVDTPLAGAEEEDGDGGELLDLLAGGLTEEVEVEEAGASHEAGDVPSLER